MKARGRSRKRKNGILSRPKILLAGGGAACALALMAVISSGAINSPSQGFTPSPLPVASGTDSSLAPSGSEPESNADTTSEPATDLIDGVTASENENETDEEISQQVHFTDSNFALLRSSPDKFVNATVTISGKIYEIVDQSSTGQILITYRIYNQAIDSDESRAVVMYQQAKRTGTVKPDIAIDECISISGKIRGGIGDTNSLGTAIRIPIIDSESVSEIECIDSAMPALQTIDSNLTQSFAGLELKAERVQISDGHLRIKIIATNNEGGDSVFIREKESHAEYQGRLHQSLNHQFLFSAYRLEPALPAESQTSGYLFFEPLQQYTGGPITFKVVVEKVGISESQKSTFILKI